MMRVCVSVAVLVGLTSAYVLNPIAGWAALGTTFAYLAVRRGKKAELRTADLEAQ